MQSAGFNTLPGLVGFVSRSVSVGADFTLGFEPEGTFLEENSRSVTEVIAQRESVSNSDSSVLDWMDETLGEALRLRRF